jgi:hypothetical protein
MQEKSLPFFRTKQPNQQDQQQPDPLNPISSQSVYGTGPNLISQEELLPPNLFYIDKAFKFFRSASFFIVITFGIMLAANFVVNLKLESQRKMINQLADEVGRYTLVEKQATEIKKRTDFYESTLSKRHLLGDKAQTIFLNIDPTTSLNTISITPEKFTMTIEVLSPLDFAKLVSRYLESGRIASITLRSADLLANKNVFKIVLEGTYK